MKFFPSLVADAAITVLLTSAVFAQHDEDKSPQRQYRRRAGRAQKISPAEALELVRKLENYEVQLGLKKKKQEKP